MLRCGGISDGLLRLPMKQRSVFDGVETKIGGILIGPYNKPLNYTCNNIIIIIIIIIIR